MCRWASATRDSDKHDLDMSEAQSVPVDHVSEMEMKKAKQDLPGD